MGLSLNQLQVLRDEISNDPLARGYATMSDAEIADSLREILDRTIERPTLSASEIFEAIDENEYDALSAGQKQKLGVLLGLGDLIQIGTGSRARGWLLSMFPPGTATRVSLIALATLQSSRAEELGLGRVLTGDVMEAKRAP